MSCGKFHLKKLERRTNTQEEWIVMKKPFPNSSSRFTHRPLTSSCPTLPRTWAPAPTSSALRDRVQGTQYVQQDGHHRNTLPALLARSQDVYFLLPTCASPALGPEAQGLVLLQMLAHPPTAGPKVCARSPGLNPCALAPTLELTG